MSDNTDSSKKPKARTAAQIQAELEAQREELANTVDALTAQLNPRENLAALKVQLADTAANATDEAQAFVSRVKEGDPRTTQAIGGAITAVIGLVGVILIRRSR